jgi:hypothetical protein
MLRDDWLISVNWLIFFLMDFVQSVEKFDPFALSISSHLSDHLFVDVGEVTIRQR